ncbi:GAP family protein [Xanthomarina spongicola]|uniref:Sap-like sulfolipid-1-addressing protein n=1 Tax=Xanthomarina spongicola TaxID=570520 RepID=A0A316DP96_9FLAO|nr:GAP family protein [Xanthomarina spongicola]PWK18583.1 Sap-like sulfolipid-1-addressing protein [Xanthomarina spongicola]
MDNLTFVPLAFTVMLGPQILVPMLLITRKDPVKSSLVYILSITASIILTTYIYYFVIQATHFHKLSSHGKPYFKYLLAGILFYILIKTIINRKKLTKLPKWLESVKNATLSRIALIAFFLIALMPGDIAMSFTVGSLLNTHNSSILGAFPFFAMVSLISAIPLFVYWSFGKKGNQIMDKLNIWLNTHGYVINILTLSIFIFLILF